jgi:hypothetical protein
VRRAFVTALGVAACLAATVGCSTTLHGVASPAETASAPSTPTSPAASTPGGWSPTCLVGDPCALPDSPPASGSPVCSPLPAAMVAFDDRARAEFPGGPLPTSSDRAMSRLTDLVQDVVDRCGYQVMVDVADQYPSPLYDWLRNTAVLALGEITSLPGDLRCADLQTLGFGPKQAVDYWFLHAGPPLMDADLDGIPCETVWSDVDQYMPSNY